MDRPQYNIFVMVKELENETFGFQSVEIVPPVPKAMAALVCNRVTTYCDELELEDPTIERVPTEVEAIGFCDEGATMNTVILFKSYPIFDLNEKVNGEWLSHAQPRKLKRAVAKVLSPSGIVTDI